MSDVFADAVIIRETKITGPCENVSPLLSANGLVGTAFACKHQTGHDGDHEQTITFYGNGNRELGRMDLTWVDR